ncbi:hypothetical protein M0804_013453 [Polistes exclamans]|nr:hypothetical protein M0804_013453 [Polistes exclamans]
MTVWQTTSDCYQSGIRNLAPVLEKATRSFAQSTPGPPNTGARKRKNGTTEQHFPRAASEADAASPESRLVAERSCLKSEFRHMLESIETLAKAVGTLQEFMMPMEPNLFFCKRQLQGKRP